MPAEAQMVSPEPDISQVWLDARDHWLLVASDGLWNSLKEADVSAYAELIDGCWQLVTNCRCNTERLSLRLVSSQMC